MSFVAHKAGELEMRVFAQAHNGQSHFFRIAKTTPVQTHIQLQIDLHRLAQGRGELAVFLQSLRGVDQPL